MTRLKKILFAAAAMLPLLASAQDKPEMADAMRSNGKIYIVVAVCLTILVGLFLYVAAIDRKISKLEREGGRN
jgi:EamA domain-containing membrane protein RarD